MFSHVMLGSNDLERSKRFYDATFAVLGAPEGVVDPKGRLVYVHAGGRLLLTRPLNGEPATPSNGFTLGFAAKDQAAVEAWQAAGADAGGEVIEDPAGVRQAPSGPLYIAYLRDPDGHKVCAVHRMPKA